MEEMWRMEGIPRAERSIIMERDEDAMVALGNNVVDHNYESLPQAAKEAAKKDVFNIMGCMLAGAWMRGASNLVEFVREQGGPGEATIVNFGDKVPALNAALANGTFARTWDQDDCNIINANHATSFTVPVSLAMAEREGKVRGRDVIAAVALSNDLIIRLILCYRFYHGIANVHTFGRFGAAAVAGKFLGLDKEAMANALGLAYAQGVFSHTYTSRRLVIGCGFGCRTGILAALLAQKGLEGSRNVLEGRLGYYNVFEQNQVFPDRVTADLGKVFQGVNQSIKPFPGCGGLQNAIQAVIEVMREADIKAEDIVEITLRGNDTLAYFYTSPAFYADLLIALAAVKKDISVGDLAKDKPDPEVAEVMGKIRAFSDPEIVKSTQVKVSPAIAEILTKDRKRHVSRRVDYFHGHHTKSPMSLEDLTRKFRKNAAFAPNPVPEKNLAQAIEMLCNLEQVDDVTKIIKLLG